MPRRKSVKGWKLHEWIEAEPDGTQFAFNEETIKKLKLITKGAENQEILIEQLCNACKYFRWVVRCLNQRPKIASVRAGLEEAVKYAEKNGRLIPELDEETEDTIISGVEEFLCNHGKADLCKPEVGLYPKGYLNLFVSDEQVRLTVLERFVARYEKADFANGGQPSDSSKEDLAISICNLLTKAGIKVTTTDPKKYDKSRTSRDRPGVAYQILELLLEATGEAKEDPRPYLTAAIRKAARK